ncbi:MAG TPA: hypothetical protein VF950_27195 [Planctomycetota bacterium]
MGQEIVYCSRCQIQLRGRDFEKGAAFRIDALACCLKCAPDVMKSLPNAAVQDLLKQMAAPRTSHSETSRIMTLSTSTTKTAHAGRRTRASSPSGIYVAAGVGLVIVVLLIVAVSSSAKPAPAPKSVVAAPPALPKVEPPPKPPPRPVVEEPRREPEPAQKRIAAELAAVDETTRGHLSQERFGPALDSLEAARGRMNDPEWTAAINTRAEDVQRQAAALYASLKAAALRARKEDAASIQQRVARWGTPKLAQELATALAAVEPKTAPPPPPPSPEAVALARCRETALYHALARDYAAATAELKRDAALAKLTAEDVDILRQAAQALQELRMLPSKWTPSTKLSLEYLDMEGAVQRLEGAFLRMDAFRAELEVPGAGPVAALLGEVRTGSLARHWKAANPTADARALALLCLVEGEPEAARALAEALPERYVAWANKRAASPLPGREKEAYAQLAAAERGYENPAATAESVRLHAGLLKDYADTRVVRRNLAFISARAQGGKEHVFFPEDMAAGGAFSRVKNPKTESCFLSTADVDAAKIPENYVEVAFSTLPDVEYRGWAFVGACCAETFAFGWQATGLAGAEPGGAAWLPVKNTLVSLKKTHAAHGGPKGPSRWEWIPLPLPKTAGTGPRKLRLLTSQQGFSVGLVTIGASKNPPRDSDLKALPAARAQTPGVKPLNRSAPAPTEKPAEPATTVVFALDLTGGQKPPLFSQGEVVKAPDRAGNTFCLTALPTKNEVNLMYMGDGGTGIFTFEGEEVLTFEYWVDAGAQKINFNFWDKTQNVQHSGVFEPLVVGKWTRVSMRLADLQGAPLRAGDRVAGLYMHAYGGSKFYVDNLQVVLPRRK